MSDKTGIEWTDATWNPVTGCTKVSPGCDHCYAETIAHRFSGTLAYPNGFAVTLRPERLDQPLRWRRPRRIFVNSMADLFHDAVPDDYIAQVFAVMALAPRHTFQVLTKRHARMRSLLNSSAFQTSVAEHMLAMTDADEMKDAGDPFPLPNVWLGVSTENQQWADVRIPVLLATPAAVRFISAEPLLGAIDLAGYLRCPDPDRCGPGPCSSCATADNAEYPDRKLWCTNPLDWVIVGGESGPGARPMHPDWARSLRDQCEGTSTSFLFKQWGEYRPAGRGDDIDRMTCIQASTGVVVRHNEKRDDLAPGGWAAMRRVGKKSAGRELDGQTWDQYPEATV